MLPFLRMSIATLEACVLLTMTRYKPVLGTVNVPLARLPGSYAPPTLTVNAEPLKNAIRPSVITKTIKLINYIHRVCNCLSPIKKLMMLICCNLTINFKIWHGRTNQSVCFSPNYSLNKRTIYVKLIYDLQFST
jgi:hypothetical protein